MTTILQNDFPLVKKTENGLQIEIPERRLAWGVAKRDGADKLLLLVEKPEGPAHHRAEELRSKYPSDVIVEVIGTAHAAKPPVKREKATRNPGPLQPGVSISHADGYPGSVGCLVKVGKESPFTGAVSASHVLSLLNRAQEGDNVLHPGRGDCRPRSENIIGRLGPFSVLSPVTEDSGDPENRIEPINCDDAAVARLADKTRIEGNVVPDPADPANKTIRLKGCVEFDRLPDLSETVVCKVGRTTKFTRGRFDVAALDRYPIRLSNNRYYLFCDVCLVSSVDGPFSDSGDSGGLVYTTDGFAVGLIIGGTRTGSLVSPLSECLGLFEEAKLIL